MPIGALAANPLLGAGLNQNPSVKIPQMRSNPLPMSAVAGFYQQNQQQVGFLVYFGKFPSLSERAFVVVGQMKCCCSKQKQAVYLANRHNKKLSF